MAKGFLPNVWSTFVRSVNGLKRRLIGKNTKDVENLSSTKNAVMPDMDISKDMQNAIQNAAMKAKLLFDTYHWTWGENSVPSVKEIVDTYTEMVNEVWEQACAVVGGETYGKGNVMKGRLTCEFVDEEWSFGIMLATTFNDDREDDEEETDERGLPIKVLANHKQLNV